MTPGAPRRGPFGVVLPLMVALAALAAGAHAQDADSLADLGWREIGPAVTGGRIVDFAVIEDDPDRFWVATASGGVWKTVNGGTTWEPQFDRERRVGLGGIAVARTNPAVVWVGTGEPNARNLRSSTWGDGVYRSRDGGATWRRMGLEHSQQIGRVVIDARDEDTVYVSALGSMWNDDPLKTAARGLWRTRDGGDSWEKVLDAGSRAGVVEVVQDLSRPDRLYAASWERERRDWSYVGRGPGSAIWASRDGGDTWRRLTGGLPDVELGRIGLSVCRSAPDVVYAVIEAPRPHGGLYRSDDGGASWEHRSGDVGSSMYYGQVRCDPRDADRVYVLETRMSISDDGGRTFRTDIPDAGVHVDHHALWIDPADPDDLLLGNDGGVYLSRDRGATWAFAANLPITQFYTVAVDRRRPWYRVYGGTQDNNSLGGPSGSRNRGGVSNEDWYVTVGGDGFVLQIDPRDPDVVFTEWQYGNLVRFDATTGERKAIQPAAPAGETYRWNWSAPVLLSEHGDLPVYFGAQYLFRSRDRGNSWERLGPDLTRALEVDPEHRISDYGTLRVITESPLRAGLLAVGTDDGLVQVSEDGGAAWRRAEPLPGVPDTWQIVRVSLSAHAPDRLYAAASGHEWDDFAPYLLRSEDLGRTWERIDGGLPIDGPIRAFAEHPAHPGVLWVGTEHGVFATLDGGATWRSMQLDLPTVPIHDLVIHPDTQDVVLGTHGRGFWILDATGSLVALAANEGRPGSARVLGTRPGLRVVEFDRGKRNQGSARYTAASPPEGVLLDVWMPAGEDGLLTVSDPGGAVVRRMTVESRDAGALRRLEWDLRTDPLYTSPGEPWGVSVPGPRVVSGRYEVLLEAGETQDRTTVEVRPDPDLDASPADRRLQFETAAKAGRALGRARATAGAITVLDAQLAAAREAAAETAGAEELVALADRLLEEARRLRELLDGGDDDAARPVLQALGTVYRQVEGSPSRPTGDELETIERARAALASGIAALGALQTDFDELARALDAAGARWTPGRALGGDDGE